MGVCNCYMLCCTLLYVHFSIAIILMGKRELIALLNLSSWCLVMVDWLFLAVPRGCLQFVIVVFPDHAHLLFFTNPFSSSFEGSELYFLSFGVPAKPGIAKDLIEADDIGRKAFADFIDSLLVKKSVFHIPHKMLQANKVLMLARSSKKKLSNLQNVKSQMRA